MAGKRYTFVLNFGYAESQSLAYMPWSSRKTYKDAKEALIDLALFLQEQFIINNNSETDLNKCCVATKTKDPEAKFCSKCGRDLQKREFDGELFIEWVQDLETDIDSFNQLIDYSTEYRWNSEGLEGALNQRFVYNAELVLAAAIGHVHHEAHTFEAICKDRTKNKKTSFSYW